MRDMGGEKAQVLSGTVQSSGGLLLGCRASLPGKELGGASLAAGCALPPVTAHRKTYAERYFAFLNFFLKAKILFGFLSVNETRYEYRLFFLFFFW